MSTRNVKIEVNFGRTKAGEDRDPAHPAPEGEGAGDLSGHELAGRVATSERVRGTERIEKREDCEMILLVGLPAAGKTTWAHRHREADPEKRYYVIGTNALVERMKVDGEPRKKHFQGKWDHLIQKCTRCLQDWLRVASQRRRNYIIDQVRVQDPIQRTFFSWHSERGKAKENVSEKDLQKKKKKKRNAVLFCQNFLVISQVSRH